MAVVSVVIPVYNGVAFLQESVGSILAQTYQDWELILVNDASTDDSANLIRSFDDQRIRCIDQAQNGGTARATNAGVDAATGKYVAFLDQDDIAIPQRLEKQVRLMNGNPRLSILGGQMLLFGARADATTGMPSHDGAIKANLLAGANNLCNPTVMIRREFLHKRSLRWDPECGTAFDWDFFVRAMHSGATFSNLPDAVIRYRIHEEQQTRDQSQVRPILRGIRLRCMQSFFPRLSQEERDLLEPLLQWAQPPAMDHRALEQGLAIIPKAFAEKKSALGEDRLVVNAFLQACQNRWTQAMAQSGR